MASVSEVSRSFEELAKPNRFVVVDHEPNWEIHDNQKGLVLGEIVLKSDAEYVAKLLNTMWVCVNDLEDLMSQSDGVYGLHLNGDVSPWDELTNNEWLESYAAAINV